MKINGRDWKWWVVMNGKVCLFCHDQDYPHGRVEAGLGLQTNSCVATDKSFMRKLYQVWVAHMKQYHPDIYGNREP